MTDARDILVTSDASISIEHLTPADHVKKNWNSVADVIGKFAGGTFEPAEMMIVTWTKLRIKSLQENFHNKRCDTQCKAFRTCTESTCSGCKSCQVDVSFCRWAGQFRVNENAANASPNCRPSLTSS
jgi:hypothetical protein